MGKELCLALRPPFRDVGKHLLEAAGYSRGSERAPEWGPGGQQLCSMVTEDQGSEEGIQNPPEKAVRSASRSSRGSRRGKKCPGPPHRGKGSPDLQTQPLLHTAASWTKFRGCSPSKVPRSWFVGPPAWRTSSQGFHIELRLGAPSSSSLLFPLRDQLLQGRQAGSCPLLCPHPPGSSH